MTIRITPAAYHDPCRKPALLRRNIIITARQEVPLVARTIITRRIEGKGVMYRFRLQSCENNRPSTVIFRVIM